MKNEIQELTKDLRLRKGSVLIELAGANSTVNLVLTEKVEQAILVAYEIDPLYSPFTKQLSLESVRDYREHIGNLYRGNCAAFKVFAGYTEGNVTKVLEDLYLLSRELGYSTLNHLLETRDVVLTLDTCNLSSIYRLRKKINWGYHDGMPSGFYLIMSGDNYRHPGIMRKVAQDFFKKEVLLSQLEIPRRMGVHSNPRTWTIFTKSSAEDKEKLNVDAIDSSGVRAAYRS